MTKHALTTYNGKKAALLLKKQTHFQCYAIYQIIPLLLRLQQTKKRFRYTLRPINLSLIVLIKLFL